MQYNLKEMSVPATCKEVTVTLNHTGKLPAAAMGHNWVLASTADYQTVATAGMSAGAENGYLPKDDPRVLAHTKLIGGGDFRTRVVTYNATRHQLRWAQALATLADTPAP
jgi:azurin